MPGFFFDFEFSMEDWLEDLHFFFYKKSETVFRQRLPKLRIYSIRLFSALNTGSTKYVN